MSRRPPGSTRTDTLLPYTTRFRSSRTAFTTTCSSRKYLPSSNDPNIRVISSGATSAISAAAEPVRSPHRLERLSRPMPITRSGTAHRAVSPEGSDYYPHLLLGQLFQHIFLLLWSAYSNHFRDLSKVARKGVVWG